MGCYWAGEREEVLKACAGEKVGEHLSVLSGSARLGPVVRETLFWCPLLPLPSVGSSVAPDVDPERDDQHGSRGVVEDGAEDPVYAFIQGHGFHLLSRNFWLGLVWPLCLEGSRHVLGVRWWLCLFGWGGLSCRNVCSERATGLYTSAS